MYAPVAQRLGVSREIAKVAVLGAMYGQTTGHGAAALRGLDAAYPMAMGYLTDAARAAEAGNDLRTRGGRRVRMGGGDRPDRSPNGTNAREPRPEAATDATRMVQGAAAEFFKTWAVIVRARLSATVADRAVPPRRAARARTGRRCRRRRRDRRRRAPGDRGAMAAARDPGRRALRRRHQRDRPLVGSEVSDAARRARAALARIPLPWDR